MATSRLELALDAELFDIPVGRIGIWGPSRDMELSVFPKDQVQIIHGFRPDHDVWGKRGFDVTPTPSGTFDLAMVCLPRAKDEALGYIAAAAQICSGPIIIDGQKTDGVDSVLKLCRKRAEISEVLSKSHGKLFVLTGHDGFADWLAKPQGPEGFVTAPGVFSADKVDKGSRLLAEAMPDDLKGEVADLGAGWGFLSASVLKQAAVTKIHLIEANHAALECARQNIPDARAEFHWADATTYDLRAPVDVVICNPPFHTSRKADPALGKAFIASAARLLKPRGVAYFVANRHLPYEASLSEHFGQVEEFGGDGGFKLLMAARPKTKPRHRL